MPVNASDGEITNVPQREKPSDIRISTFICIRHFQLPLSFEDPASLKSNSGSEAIWGLFNRMLGIFIRTAQILVNLHLPSKKREPL